MIKNQLDITRYPRAALNMAADLSMLETLPEHHRAFRLYIWPTASLTYGYNQKLPDRLAHLESAKRPTGGGIVFHSPGDMVLSIAYFKDDPAFPKKASDLGFLSHYLSEVFKKASIPFNDNTNKGPKDTLFCATYENPYERYYNNQKIIGISTRRFRKKVLIQCIIHLENGHKHFSDSLLANKYSSKGLLNYNSRSIQKYLKTQLNHLCKKTPFQWTS